jgi:hypothetical protein
MAPHKTEALFFHDGSRGEPPEAHILVDGTRVEVGPTIKYLGLVLMVFGGSGLISRHWPPESAESPTNCRDSCRTSADRV